MIRQLGLIWANPTLRLMTFLVFAFGCAISGMGIYQSVIAIKTFGIPDGWYSTILLVALFVNTAAAIGVGIITDQRPDRKRMAMIASASFCVAGTLVYSFANAWAYVAASMLLLPIGATLFTQCFAVMRLASAPYARTDREGIMAIIRAVFAMPFMTVVPVWGYVLSHGVPLITVYLATAVISAILFITVALFWPHDSEAPWVEVKSGLNFRASIAEMMAPNILLKVILVGVVHCGQAINGIVAGLLIVATPGRDVADVAMFFGVFVAIEVAATLMVGEIVRHLPRLTIIAIGAFMYASFLFLFPLLADTWAIWLLTFPAGAGGALVYALAISYLQDQLGSRAGAGGSLIALQRLFSDSLAAAIFAIGAVISGYGLAAMIGAITMSVAMAALLVLDKER